MSLQQNTIAGINVRVVIDGMVVARCPRCVVSFDRHTVTSYGEIDVPDPEGVLMQRVKSGQHVSVRFGYRGQPAREWTGLVDGWRPGFGRNRDQLTVQVLGPEFAPFMRTRVTEAYMDETADVLARLILAKTGCTVGTVDVPAVNLPRLTLRDVPVWQAMEQLAHSCAMAHGQDMSHHALWLDDAGAIQYGPHNDEPEAVPVIATGAGLIAHNPAQSPKARGSVETFLLPGMRDGRLFKLQDVRRGIDAEYRAVHVEHHIEQTKARTWLWYGGEYERF
ncbi:hypothetical protein [Oleidesulfovibrio alaskensis]|jgi:hypothetical protein|uniref:hypothetical protein n=1 Tax=Oleidesulfovibrio alaskensis TaxID=58180 RepID=UPI001A4D4691|nr:hypothetical protein [Oleidesulfovibrio alaskensis]MBL3580850.1 hypothetical protein [Oleidesulfovibrio alaskensis]MBL3587927.1 hypothetical protein [bacterium]